MPNEVRTVRTPFDVHQLYAETGKVVVTPTDLESGQTAGPLSEVDRAALTRVLNWVDTDIMRQVQKGDRLEAVCPFAKPAINARLLYLTIAHLSDPSDPRQILEELATCATLFLRIPTPHAKDASLRGLMVLYPDTPDPMLNVALTSPNDPRRSARTGYIRRGIMIGEAFPTDPDPSTWDPNIFPARSPVPFLILRNLIESDWKFAKKRPAWRGAYRAYFGKTPDDGLSAAHRTRQRIEELIAVWRG